MKKYLVAIFAAVALFGCGPSREVVQIYKGDPGKDGTSCTVAPELDTETYSVLGARISCTDGSFSIVYNGEKGDQGVQGPQGNQGIQGPAGQPGLNAQPCQAYRVGFLSTVFLSCPGQFPVPIFDGQDGRDGVDGESCSSTRQNNKNRVEIVCGNKTTYVYDGEEGKKGEKGKDGASCTVTPASGGADVKCGNAPSVFLANGSPGPKGAQGPQGEPGRDGLDGDDGADGEDAVKPGISCNVHDLSDWNGVTNIETILASNAPKGKFVLSNLNVGDTPSANGFPGMPSTLQDKVGKDGYALDCYGYLNVPTSGTHVFKSLSDDGIKIVIQDQTIINDPSLHSPSTHVSTARTLYRGPNKINVIYYQGPHNQIALQLKWSGPNISEQVIPAAHFTH